MIEMLIVMAVFMVVTSAVFGLLGSAQIRYRSEQQLVEALQGARVALEQITRDIHRAGYPPVSGYDSTLTFPRPNGYYTDRRIAVKFPGIAGSTLNTTCIVHTVTPGLGTCDVPGPFQLLIETDLDPEHPDADQRERVEWIYYRLETPGTTSPLVTPEGGGIKRTLYRLVSDKTLGVDPRNSGVVKYKGETIRMVPFVEDVMNDPDPSNGGGPVNDAVFKYVCANFAVSCPVSQIVEVQVELRVQTRSPNLMVPESGGKLNYRTVVLRTIARSLNP